MSNTLHIISTRRFPTFHLLRLVFLLLFHVSLQSSAQILVAPPEKELKGDSIWVRGYVVDNFTRFKIEDVNVQVMRKDSTFVTGAQTKDNGKEFCKKKGLNPAEIKFPFDMTYYSFDLPSAGEYILRFSCVGYETRYVNLKVPQKQYGKRVHKFFPEEVRLKRNAIEIGEASVTASKIKMVMHGDTLIYNATAFQLAEGSMLDRLMSMLPGVELKSGGQIFVNGKYVQSLLVNGKDFFDGDPKVALENLPAYTVNKIKVYEKAADNEYLRNPADTIFKRERPLVVDVNLKREYAQGWIANIEAGYGTHDRYQGKAFALRYTDHSRISLYANINNTNNTAEPGTDGNWSPTGRPSGLQVTKKGGIDFSVDSRKHKTSYNTNVRGYATDNDYHSEQSATHFLPQGDVFSRWRNATENNSRQATWKQNFSVPTKWAHISVGTTAAYSTTKKSTTDHTVQFSEDPLDTYRMASLDSVFAAMGSSRLNDILVNSKEEAGIGESTDREVAGNVGVSMRSPLTDNLMVLSLSGTYKDRESTQYSHYDLRYADPTMASDYRNQHQDAPERNHSWGGNLFYDWMMARYSKMTINYNYSNTYKMNDRNLYRLDRVEGWGNGTQHPLGTLPSIPGWESLALDIYNSYHTAYRNQTSSISISSISGNKKVGEFTVNMGIRFLNDKLHDVRELTSVTDKHRRAVDINSSFYYHYNDPKTQNTYHIGYTIKDTPPDIYNLLDVTDSSNPLSILKGNDALKNQRAHTVSLSAYRNGVNSWSVSVSYDLWKNSVSQAMTYDPQTGVYTWQPRNIDGNWNISTRGRKSLDLDKARRLRLNANASISYGNSAGFTSKTDEQGVPVSVRNSVQNLFATPSASLDYSIKSHRISLIGALTYRHSESQLESFTTINALDFNYGITLNTRLFDAVDVGTDIMMWSRRGYSDNTMNTNHLIWNAAASGALGRKKKVVLKVEGYDMLRQISNVRRNINAQGVTELWYNTTPAYFMASLTYRLHILPKKKTGEK